VVVVYRAPVQSRNNAPWRWAYPLRLPGAPAPARVPSPDSPVMLLPPGPPVAPLAPPLPAPPSCRYHPAPFVDVSRDDGSVMQRADIRIAPAYLMRLHVIVVEIPESSWGVRWSTIDTAKISKLIGAALFGTLTLPYNLGTVASFDYTGFNGRSLRDNVMDNMLWFLTNSPLGTGIAPDHARFTHTFPYVQPVNLTGR
jgi:hypothetical protein